jgi:hypothetical protein
MPGTICRIKELETGMRKLGIEFQVSLKSFFKGIAYMRPGHEKVNYAIRILRKQHSRGFWLCLWTPIYHENRGPYVSIGLGIIAIYRGY